MTPQEFEYPKGYAPVRDGLVEDWDLFLHAPYFNDMNKVVWVLVEPDDIGQPVGDFELIVRKTA